MCNIVVDAYRCDCRIESTDYCDDGLLLRRGDVIESTKHFTVRVIHHWRYACEKCHKRQTGKEKQELEKLESEKLEPEKLEQQKLEQEKLEQEIFEQEKLKQEPRVQVQEKCE